MWCVILVPSPLLPLKVERQDEYTWTENLNLLSNWNHCCWINECPCCTVHVPFILPTVKQITEKPHTNINFLVLCLSGYQTKSRQSPRDVVSVRMHSRAYMHDHTAHPVRSRNSSLTWLGMSAHHSSLQADSTSFASVCHTNNADFYAHLKESSVS